MIFGSEARPCNGDIIVATGIRFLRDGRAANTERRLSTAAFSPPRPDTLRRSTAMAAADRDNVGNQGSAICP